MKSPAFSKLAAERSTSTLQIEIFLACLALVWTSTFFGPVCSVCTGREKLQENQNQTKPKNNQTKRICFFSSCIFFCFFLTRTVAATKRPSRSSGRNIERRGWDTSPHWLRGMEFVWALVKFLKGVVLIWSLFVSVIFFLWFRLPWIVFLVVPSDSEVFFTFCCFG